MYNSCSVSKYSSASNNHSANKYKLYEQDFSTLGSIESLEMLKRIGGPSKTFDE